MRIVSRNMRDEDRDFVIGNWLSSYRRSPHAGLISMPTWRAVMGPELAGILAREQVRTIVIDDVEESTRTVNLLGFVVWQLGHFEFDTERRAVWKDHPPLVYFAYVKHGHRGHGLLRVLLRAAGMSMASRFDYVCQTHAAIRLCEAGKLPNARWRPLLGRYANERNDHEREAEPE